MFYIILMGIGLSATFMAVFLVCDAVVCPTRIPAAEPEHPKPKQEQLTEPKRYEAII